MIPVANRKQETLISIIQQWIHPGSNIHSDCWNSYKSSKIGYTHVSVNHSKEFLNESNAACTNAIESDWRHAKVLMPHYGVCIYNAHLLDLIEFLFFLRCTTCQCITFSFFATFTDRRFHL